ncbi:hypothetical protein WN943_006504 [Citrus x changshan-huyou]
MSNYRILINTRPPTTRFISRSLPQGISRAFIGRMLADPAFLYKLLLEQAATIGCTVLWELENHKERVLNVQLGERSRLAWLGVEADPLLQSYDLLKKAYNGAAQDVNGSTQKSPRWLISKNANVSGLGLLGIKQGNVDSVEGEARAPKVRRKRIVRKKCSDRGILFLMSKYYM